MTARPDKLVTLEDAATSLGVHYMTAYRYVRLGRLPAEQRGGRWWVDPGDVDRLRATAQAAPGRGRAQSGRRWAGPRDRLLDRLLAGDGPGSWAVVERALAGGAAAGDIHLRLLAPAMRTIGDRWADGSIGVDAEHRASAVAMRLVGRLGPLFARRGPTARGTVVLGGAPGDPHLLPLLMAADILRQAGVRVVDLGADLPEQSFLDAAGAVDDLRAIAVSVSTDGCTARAADVAAAVRQAHPDCRIYLGGPAQPTEQAARDLGADGWSADAVGLVRLLEAPGPPTAVIARPTARARRSPRPPRSS
jgi:methanogenic corrinoid protein MtbC1